MIPLPAGTKIWLVAGITDMRNGFNGLAAKVQTEPPRFFWRVFSPEAQAARSLFVLVA